VLDNQDESKVRAILSPIDALSFGRQVQKFKGKLDEGYPGTCSWSLSNKDITQWFDRPGEVLLWIYALHGVGKSVTCAYVIENLVPIGSGAIGRA